MRAQYSCSRSRRGPGSRVWRRALLADGVHVGNQCPLGTDVHLGRGTRVGDRVKIQNAVQAFGAAIHDEVLLCPSVLIIEDRARLAPSPPQDYPKLPTTGHRGR
ncbi:hypothetical protein [Amycolatopsis magusensis]|uniref:hypothetical protein n=1 Tax=Amycolatopsis magusensis TaxID=882444 RepID=UPI0037B47CF3